MKDKEYERKYTMYIIDFSEWITYFNFDLQISNSYCFETGQWDSENDKPVEPYKLNIEEAIWCIVDCNLKYNGYRFKIYPEKEFLKEYDEFRKNNKERIEQISSYGGGVDFDNILNFKKREQVVEFIKINRNTFIDFQNEKEKERLYTYYNLTCDGIEDFQSQSKLIANCALKARPDYSYEFERRNRYWTASTPIISIKKSGEEYIFETVRSIYRTKTIIEPKGINTINELEYYLKSDEFKEFIKVWENTEMLYAK